MTARYAVAGGKDSDPLPPQPFPVPEFPEQPSLAPPGPTVTPMSFESPDRERLQADLQEQLEFSFELSEGARHRTPKNEHPPRAPEGRPEPPRLHAATAEA